MKSILSFVMALSLAVAFTACGGGDTPKPTEPKPVVETTTACTPAPGEICPA